MNECIFCSIANGDPTKLVWSNEVAAAFKDLHPAAPVHILVVPKQHVVNLDDFNDRNLAGELLLAVSEVALRSGVAGGWRLKVNNGEPVGQTVPHLHFHIMGGMKLAE